MKRGKLFLKILIELTHLGVGKMPTPFYFRGLVQQQAHLALTKKTGVQVPHPLLWRNCLAFKVATCLLLPVSPTGIICLNTGEVFRSQRDTERKYNLHRGYLFDYLNGARKMYKDGIQYEWDYYNEN